jgi:DNA-binding CsgD family transcriptional regulator/tetratricopeptide (TPR) repeat protein
MLAPTSSARQYEDSPEAAEGIALAAWFLEDGATTIAANEHAYHLYRKHENSRGAGRVATWLGWHYRLFHNDLATASGWLRRAHRLLDDLPACVEQGQLALRDGFNTFAMNGDAVEAGVLGERAAAIGRQCHDMGLEIRGIALQGRALLHRGLIEEGMRLLDESSAAILGGEITDGFDLSMVACELLYACHAVRDYERATLWCDHLMAHCERWRIPSLFGVCRTRYADLLQWRGRWNEAETQLHAAERTFEETRPGLRSDAVVRLAELRRRQGRFEEAATLFAEAGPHPLALLGGALLAIDRQDTATAVNLAQRYLRRTPSDNLVDRAPGLETLIFASIAGKELDQARDALEELRGITRRIATQPMLAGVHYCAGLVAAGAEDHENARPLLEDAIDLFSEHGAAFEAACVRMALGRSLIALDRPATARHEVMSAAATFRALASGFELQRAEEFLAALERPSDVSSGGANMSRGGLTQRETEVLRLVAQGMTNAEIAGRLCVSGHTVHRHVANILTKLDVPSRAAATAWAVQRGLV